MPLLMKIEVKELISTSFSLRHTNRTPTICNYGIDEFPKQRRAIGDPPLKGKGKNSLDT
jgi:hypothetical protein